MLMTHRPVLSFAFKRFSNFARTSKHLKLTKFCSFPPKLTWSLPVRKFHGSKSHFLKLENEQTFEKWDKDYWSHRHKLEIEKSKRGIKVSTYSQCLAEIRRVFFVLTKNDFDFSLPDNKSRYTDDFYSEGVLATTYIPYAKYPDLGSFKFIVIKDKYNSLDEWNSITEQLNTDEYSKNLRTNAVMEFILLHKSDIVKADRNIDISNHLRGELITSFIDYLLSSEDTLEICQRSLVLFFKACNRTREYEIAENVYSRLKEKKMVLSSTLIVTLMEVLSETKHWKDLYELPKTIFYFLPKDRVKYLYDILASCALKHGDLENGLRYLKKVFDFQSSMGPNQSTVLPFLEAFKYDEDEETWNRNREVVENFFSLCADRHFFPRTTKIAVAIGEWFKDIKNEKWEYKMVEDVDIHGQTCPFTQVNLIKKELTNEEYDLLGRLVFSQVLNLTMNEELAVSKDHMTTTSPKERKSFMTMMYEQGPYDIVVDGLNGLHMIKNKLGKRKKTDKLNEKEVTLMDYWLRTIVERRSRVVGRKLNVLIVFRRHVRRLIPKSAFSDYADIWYSMDSSHDDPYFLYAAMLSGQPCRLFTADLLRNMKSLLGKVDFKHEKLLYKWQQIHQDYTTFGFRKLKRQWFDIRIQKTDRTWHFPYYHGRNEGFVKKGLNPEPTNWLCLKRVD